MQNSLTIVLILLGLLAVLIYVIFRLKNASSININDSTVRKWQKTITADAEAKLGRPLKDYEKTFITSRGGFIALEMIHDTVKASEKPELEVYLKSEFKGELIR
jgi:hypothetical protein